MMSLIRSLPLVGVTLLSAAVASGADTIQLKSGATFVGEVVLKDDGAVQIAARFPRKETLTFSREELQPRSLYDLVDRRVAPGDAEARLSVAELAQSSGLYALAISDYMAVADMRPEREAEMVARIREVKEAIAAEILSEVKLLLEEGHPRVALMHLHSLRELYPDTAAAKRGAKELMTTARARAGASVDVAEKTVSPDRAPKVISELRKDVEKGRKEMQKLQGHEGSSSRDSRAAKKAIREFESAWNMVKSLPVSVPDHELQTEITHLRKSVKEMLAQAYLTAGTIELQRYSIPNAEEFCNKACELQPEDKSNHQLHRLILEAKIYGGGIGWGRGI